MTIGTGEILIGVGVFFAVLTVSASMKKKNKEDEETKAKRQKLVDDMTRRENEREERITEQNKKLDILSKQVNNVIGVNIPVFTGFKTNVIEQEDVIIAKGGEKELMDFLKIDSFLLDFSSKIQSDQEEWKAVFDLEYFKQKVREEANRKDIGKVREHFHDMAASLEGGVKIGFDSKLDQLFEIGNNLEDEMKNKINTLEFYHNMASAMLAFYVSDKKIRYFEIYNSFERLGVFDSTWQKNVLGKLGSIESRLVSIDNQMTELNQSFKSILDSNESMVNELKELNSAMVSNNLLQGITAYQAYRINRRLRG
jgi:hypothetical protein